MKLLLILCLISPVTVKAGACDNIIAKCDSVIKAQDAEIEMLKEAIKSAHERTNQCLEEKADCVDSGLPSWVWFVFGGLAGTAAGLTLK